VPLVAGWSEGRPAAVLSIAAPAGAPVRVDGVEVGAGSFVLRAPPGRHLVESGTASRWVEVDGGAETVTLVDPARSERPSQVDAQLRAHRGDVRLCAERGAGAEGSLEVEIGIGADGSVNFVAPVRASTAPEVDACLANLLRDRFTFPRGAAATVRKVISY
jgi:hypothetical protein